MEYQVGSLLYFKDTDPKFADWATAADYAVEQSIDDSVYGVWKDDGDLKAIVYQGEVFEK